MTAGSVVSTADILRFWGKTSRDGSRPAWHPVVFHLLDVAAAADAILAVRRVALARAARLLGLEPDAARRLLVMLIALHDLGKFGVAFQAKRPDLWPSILGDPYVPPNTPHTVDGLILWRDVLAQVVSARLWPNGGSVLSALAPAIFGHHGRPPVLASIPASHRLGANGVRVAEACAAALLDLLHPEPLQATCVCDEAQVRVASWWVSGLVTVSDWVGSHEEWFPYEIPREDLPLDVVLRDYWRETRARADNAVREAGLIPAPVAATRDVRDFTNGRAPTPAQAWASTVALPPGPVLVVLEDVTGAGKTEAAQILVHRLMADGHATGAYWAMPTQATANAMYERQREMLPRLYAPDAAQVPSLVLTHGQARLYGRFRSTVMGNAGARARASAPVDADEGDQGDVTSVVACAAFLADDRRTSFLADVGAGTIDQAVLGVLPSKFNTVRIFGLIDKVLVLDEAHAYDAYVSEEMFALLRFHAALGGSAIILSATLGRQQREDIVTAWDEGLTGRSRTVLFGGNRAPRVHSSAYPLATLVASQE
ncbi:MAG TPA: CRISPR-associated endonuclease Cas3'', partial [Candidatus Elarobacter sp.]|nr:CRISPR-associated endonuclease Cas3'' [Candidatus Elarobacter sp.]